MRFRQRSRAKPRRAHPSPGVSFSVTDTARSYDAIAKQYRDSKLLPFRHAIERYTVFRELGDLRGRPVLDLACGEGIYARQFRHAGAAV